MAEITIRADVAGSIWKAHAKPGDRVGEGDELFVIESMKMEIPVTAPAAGTIKSVAVKESDQIEENQALATLST